MGVVKVKNHPHQDNVVLEDRQRLVRKPHVRTVDLGRLFPGIDFHPVDLPLAAVGLGHGRVDDLEHHRRDVEARAIALDVGDDRVVGDREAEILVDRDLLTGGRNFDVLERRHGGTP